MTGHDGAFGVARMKWVERGKSLVLVGSSVSLVIAAALVLATGPEVVKAADGGEVLVAGSVCEAHELRARAEQDPHLQIEIPGAYASPWPTREACLSHAAAGDPEAPGPLQPIQFSHKHHAGLYEIDCQYCHSGTDRSPSAGVPSVQLCMGCHQQFGPAYDELEGIRTLKDHWERKAPIEWEQVHRLPEYVQFQHRAHVQAGFECQDCHGPVEEMDKLYLTPDTKWWPWLLPTQKLEMGWCVQCHRENGATQDCLACHY
ncbi:MAG: cytochrome c3 family protein [Myxococcota bacterium]